MPHLWILPSNDPRAVEALSAALAAELEDLVRRFGGSVGEAQIRSRVTVAVRQAERAHARGGQVSQRQPVDRPEPLRVMGGIADRGCRGHDLIHSDLLYHANVSAIPSARGVEATNPSSVRARDTSQTQ